MKLDAKAFGELPNHEVYRIEHEAREIWQMMRQESGRSTVVMMATNRDAVVFVETFEQFRRLAKSEHDIVIPLLERGLIVKPDGDE